MTPDFVLSTYRRTLEAGIAAGYDFVGYADIGSESAPLTCLLRHDVDAEIFSLDPMADIEASLGIRATYFVMTRSTVYNLFGLEASRAVARLIDKGHRIGLHFMAEPYEEDGNDALIERIGREAEWLRREFGTAVQAVSLHQPSQRVLAARIQVPSLVNTYHPEEMRDYFYVADTNMGWRQEHPAEIFARRLRPRLQLLIHPIWWTERPLNVRDKWRAVLQASRRAVIGHWRERERTLRDLPPDALDD
ncbi:MAG TPA: hypothetical protein VFB20_02065 [Burkholderiales bacterium]|nr:hypothetical protein [Burkholderiales bacterium]